VSPGAPPPVLFGKLPDRADFVRHGGSPALDALDTVAQRAIWPSLPAREGPLYRFVYNPPGGPHALAGALQLSRDRVGREYPLIVGRPVDRSVLDPAAAPSWPLRWGPAFDGAAEVVRRAVAEQAPIAAVTEWVRGLPDAPWEAGRSSAVDAHVHAAAALPARDFLGRFPGGPGHALLMLRRLAAILRQPTAPGYGVRFTLPAPADDFGRSDGVSFWMAAGSQLMRARPLWPSLFWRDADREGPGALFVFYARLSSPALRSLLVGAPDPDTVLALDAEPDVADRRALSDGRSPFARLLADPNASVADVLARLHTLV
jgi:type VI secretion system ImpM family protein